MTTAKRGEQSKRIVKATPRVLQSKRNLDEDVQLAVDDQMKSIVDDLRLGAPKTGALRGVRVVTFKIDPRQYLLAYTFTSKTHTVEALDVAVHENVYRDLQNSLGAR